MHRFTTSLLASAALCAASLPPAHAEIDVVRLKAAIEKSVEGDYPKLDALYKDIHAHPEIAFQEVKTASKLAAEMRALGFDVTEKVGKTGLVAIYHNGDGPTIMVRTELDALLTPYFELIEDEAVTDSIAVFAGRERWLTWRRRT